MVARSRAAGQITNEMIISSVITSSVVNIHTPVIVFIVVTLLIIFNVVLVAIVAIDSKGVEVTFLLLSVG